MTDTNSRNKTDRLCHAAALATALPLHRQLVVVVLGQATKTLHMQLKVVREALLASEHVA